jgi:hypothetical protein
MRVRSGGTAGAGEAPIPRPPLPCALPLRRENRKDDEHPERRPSVRPTLRLPALPGLFHEGTEPLFDKVFHQVGQRLRLNAHNFHGLLSKGQE